MTFSDVSLKKKIFLLLALPVMGVLALSTTAIVKSYATYQSMVEVEESVLVATNFANLVHELQKERGMTAGFIGSKGQKFADDIIEQRRQTDIKLGSRQELLTQHQINWPSFSTLNRNIESSLRQLRDIRSLVDTNQIALNEALGFYTRINANLLETSSLIAKQSKDSTIVEQASAYYNFLQGKERAGIERAVLNNVFAQDQFSGNLRANFITLKSQQETYFDNFTVFAAPQNKRYFEEQLSHPTVAETNRLKSIALSKVESFNIDPIHWFTQATGRIGQLKSVENHLSDALVSLANTTKQDATNILVTSALLSLALIIATLIISSMVIRDIIARVDDLSNVLSRVENNNDLTAKAQLKGASELGGISNALNQTLEKFSFAIEEISTTSSVLAAGAEQTSQTCVRNSKAMNDQQDEISLVATAVEEISVTVKEVAVNTQAAVDSAQQADQKSKHGLHIVQQSYHSIEVLKQEINELASTITHLHESSNNITSVVDVIKSVADQTNLLALNAAIEAARAGEQGRGFAVVADEVRTLAQRTQESTSEIESFIGSLQADANNAFSVIEASQQKAQDAVDKSKDVEVVLIEITDSVSTIFAMTEQISVAAEEQATVTQDIAKNIINVEQKSHGATTDANEIASTAIEQAQLAQQLRTLAHQFTV